MSARVLTAAHGSRPLACTFSPARRHGGREPLCARAMTRARRGTSPILATRASAAADGDEAHAGADLRLILMRHGKSSWADANASDRSRGLAPRGVAKSANCARELVKRGWLPNLILTSDAARCLETLEAMCDAEGALRGVNIRIVPEFYDVTHGDEASGKKSKKSISKLVTHALEDSAPPSANAVQTILCIGHNYGFEKAASRLTGKKVTLKTGDAAVLRLKKPEKFKSENDGVIWGKEAFEEGAWALEEVVRAPKGKADEPSAEEIDDEEDETYDGVQEGESLLLSFVNELSLMELQEECRSRMLDDSGAASALRERLLAHKSQP